MADPEERGNAKFLNWDAGEIHSTDWEVYPFKLPVIFTHVGSYAPYRFRGTCFYYVGVVLEYNYFVRPTEVRHRSSRKCGGRHLLILG